ncbi:MAG TPA: NADH-quinone oxidoreductase subunit M [Chitinophagales bacterium]|nr:NADH-quinone oxidoreductase subunit M [Chitinophagales bacterium]HNO03241.1 NADH-quinone oxidoreductase subunit M [Chitinophagales bacterium]
MLLLLLLILPVFFAVCVMFNTEKQAKNTALFGAIATLALSVSLFFQYQASPLSPSFTYNAYWISALGATFYVKLDGINILLVLLTTLLIPFIIQSAAGKLIKSPKAYFVLILFMQSALLGVFLAKDALLFYTFWELALIPIYLIALIWGGKGRKAITFKFFVFTLFGSLFMLLAIIYMWLHNPARTFDIYDLYTVSANLSPQQQLFVFIAFYLAFAIKIPIFPLHTWQADTYQNAPTQGTMLLSGIMLKMGTFALIVWLIPMVPKAWTLASKYVIILSVISVVYGSMLALAQQNFKRLLAYSSLGHVGLIAAGIFSWNLQGVQGALYQMVSHGINVVALFYICDIISSRMQTDTMQQLGGIRNVSRVFSVLFLLVVLGSIALPLTNGFVGEFLLIHGIFQYNTIAAVVAGLTIILGAWYMLRAYQWMMHGDTNTLTESFGDITINEKIVLSCFAVLIIFFGIFPNHLLHVSEADVKELIEQVRRASVIVQ